MSKSPLELTFNELNEVIRTGKWPNGCDLTCILMDTHLAPLAKKPSTLARKILALQHKKEEKKPSTPSQVEYTPNPKGLELKERALKLKEKKLKLDEDRQVRQLDLYKLIEKMNRNIIILRKEVQLLKEEIKK